MTVRVAVPRRLAPMPVRPLSLAAVLLASLALPNAVAAQPAVDTRSAVGREVVLDGLVHEWSTTPWAYTGPASHAGHGAAASPFARVEGVKVRHDDGAVYLMFLLDGKVALQGMPGTLALVLDADADSTTGWPLHGMRGAEVAVEFSAPLGQDGARGGIGWWMADSAGGPPRLVTANRAGVMAAPTHASRTFEIRIPRDRAVRGDRLAARLISYDASGAVVHDTRAFTVDVRPPEPRPTSRGAGPTDPLARPPGVDFRVVSWNVGRETFFAKADLLGVLLRPLAPDLLMLDEVAGGYSVEEVEALLNRILPGDRPWRAVYGTSGGSQRGVIAIRGTVPVVAPALAGVLPYPDSVHGLAPAEDAWLRDRVGSYVPVTGAIVEIGGRRLLAVTVDLESGGTPGSRRDRLRRIEALAIRDALAAAVRAGGIDGVLVVGDLNLVASREPLDILAAGPDVDGSALQVLLPLRLDGASATTWEDPDQPFTPGRLDFVLVGDGALVAAGGFVFRAGDLSPAWQAQHGVDAEASSATDHLPVVTDLRWRTAPR